MRATPDDILGMAFFARVVEARSFSDAARSLGLSKSAVSARVSRLEKRLGVTLLHRTTRRLALTADGVRLYERCVRLVAEADAAADIAAGASAAPRGVLRVHASPTFAQAYLAQPIGAFVAAYPEVQIDLRVGDRLPDLAADGLDVAIVMTQRLANSSIFSKRLATTRVVACAAGSYLRRKGIPFRPQDLVLHDCLAHSVMELEDWHFDTEEGPVSMKSVARIVADERGFLHAAALQGLGIVMLPEILVLEELRSGRLHRILDDFQSIELTVRALHLHAQHPPASVRAFVDHLAASFRRPPWEERTPASAAPVRKASKPSPIAMTEQDVRRLETVAKLYAEVDPDGAARLSDALSRVKLTIAAKIPRGAVTMNSRVMCRDEADREVEISLVYPWDAADHRISVLSTTGRALLGASIGGAIELGPRKLTIASIPYQPEASGDHHL